MRNLLMEFTTYVAVAFAVVIGTGVALLLLAGVVHLIAPGAFEPNCQVLGVVHVNDAPLLYKDCNGQIVREYLWVEGE